ncbi:hypothetical protein SDC9_170502 [bioreactor metagenome]|uniref:Uncharacterized protein n=1 Tax=bioreactor metagenome TaxID=1076179 RepID=A0A645G881_9ZZZZ
MCSYRIVMITCGIIIISVCKLSIGLAMTGKAEFISLINGVCSIINSQQLFIGIPKSICISMRIMAVTALKQLFCLGISGIHNWMKGLII